MTMWKKVLLGVVGLVIVVSLGLFFWVRSVLANDGAQKALAAQISTAIGQPVTIQGLSARLYPRVGVELKGVAIGAGSEITVASLDVDTDFNALLSRRIEHAALHLNGARVQMPLLPLTLGSQSPGTEPAAQASPIELVSIDEVILSGIEIVSGGRTLKGEIDVVPQGNGLDIRTIVLAADDVSLTATGKISDLAGPVGDLSVKAGALNVDRLLTFLNDFSGGLSAPARSPGAPVPAAPSPASAAGGAPAGSGSMHLTVALEAERATMGGLTLDAMRGRAVATDGRIALEPLTFNVFGGKYDGTLSAALGTAPTFTWKAALSGIDVAAATAYAGSPNTVTGTLDGTVNISGAGSDAASAMKTVAGNVRLQVRNGIVRNLGIVRSVGAATSLSMASLKQVASAGSDTDEAFNRLGGDIAIANGVATSDNLAFEATDLLLALAGNARLDGTAMDFQGRVQLSEALSSQMNGTMVRLSQDGGKVTLPATITGTFAAPVVRIDAGDMTKRAIRNTVNEAAPKLLNKGLGRLFGK